MKTFGDARLVIVETINRLKSGDMAVERGMAIAANMKVLNDNLIAEIKAAKMSLEAEKCGKDFGNVMRLGRRTIIDDTPLIECNNDDEKK